MPKIESSISFKCSEEFASRLMKDCASLDVSKSDFIRAAHMLGSPILLDKPYLMYGFSRNKSKINSSISFKCSEAFETRLLKDCATLDVGKSDFIRDSVMLGAPILLDKPYLFYGLNRNKRIG